MSSTESDLQTTPQGEKSIQIEDNVTLPTTQNEDEVKTVQDGLSEYVSILSKDANESDESNLKPLKRKREEDDDDEGTKDILTGVYLRTMYPLSKAIDKTVTVGLFQSLNFEPAVLLNHCTKSSLLLTIDVWDNFTKYCNIIHTFLENNLTGRKTSILLYDSDIEVDSIRLRGCQYVRFRNLSKHQKKILLSHDEFNVLSNLVPAISRYIHQLVTYGNLVSNYLKAALLNTPPPQLIYGSLDASFYNKLPQEVECYRRLDRISSTSQNFKTNDPTESVSKEDLDTIETKSVSADETQ